MNYFQDKIFWITGASSGIGAALASRLAGQGARLILSGRRVQELQTMQASLAQPDSIRIVPFDLEKPETFEAAVGQAIAAFGRIDYMVHNGGISQRGLALQTTMEVQRKVMEVDYFSYIGLTKILLPHFLERKAGHFIVISSVMGKIGTPMRSAYAAAKHALHGYFDCLRAEIAGSSLYVTLLTPGYIQTAISMNAVTESGTALGVMAKDIAHGLPADRAADQILRAVRHKRNEAYIGKLGPEKYALWMARFFPNFLFRMAPRLVPK